MIKYEVGQTITMKKAHPCGGKAWKIISLGADIKLQCQTCGRFLSLSRAELEERETPKTLNG